MSEKDVTSDSEKYSDHDSSSSESEDDVPDGTAKHEPTTFYLGSMPLPTPAPRIKAKSSDPNLASNENAPSNNQAKPNHFPTIKTFYKIFALTLIWGSLWGILGKEALPGGNIFSILVVGVCCYFCGKMMPILSLPPLLGMLLTGCALKNIPYINVAEDINPIWASELRTIALVTILIRAGLGLDYKVLRKLSLVCLRLAFMPCLTEATVSGLMAHFILGFPWIWGFLLGFILAAVSPAVVVPSMISLTERGLGVDKGIPTLVIAASSVDDVLAITGFGIILSFIFSEGSIAWIAVKGPLEVLAGIIYGVVIGSIFWYLPQKNKNGSPIQTLLLVSGGLFVMFGSRALDFSGAGAIGCLTMSFIASIKWREQGRMDAVAQMMALFWVVFQPLLFGLIGAEIVFHVLDLPTVGKGLMTLGVGLVFRMLATIVAVLHSGLNLKEQIFIALAWLPKATVQAALGPVALDMVRHSQRTPEEEAIALQILTVAVISILLTAPLGAVAIAVSGPRLLNKQRKSSTPELQAEGDLVNTKL